MKIVVTNAVWLIRKITEYFSMIFIGAMALVVILSTMSRYVFKIPIFWAEELSRLFMVWACLLGAAIAMRLQDHVRATFMISLLPKKLRTIVVFLSNVIVAIFMILMIKYSFDLLPIIYLQISPTLRIPMAVAYSSIPVGAALILMETIAVAIKEVRGKI